jgi:4a-hydroxytetrahydrobiopterin dehydratase
MKTPSKNVYADLKKKGWACSAKKLSKSYEFKDFNDAFAFMTRCALDIARLDHHPDWSNSYNKLDVTLSTHNAGGVTSKDVELAYILDKIALGFKLKKK